MGKSIKQSLSIGVLSLIALVVGGCGEDGGSNRIRDIKDIKHIEYQLESASLTADLSQPGGDEHLSKNVRYNSNTSKDKLVRAINGNDFVLVVNDKKVDLKVFPDGTIQYQQGTQAGSSNCKVIGESKVSGKANEEFDFTWELEVRLEGEHCSTQDRDAFVQFQTNSVNALNLQTVKDLLQATEIKQENLSQLKLKVHMTGIGS